MLRLIIWTFNAQEDRKAIFTFWNKNNRSNVYSKKLNNLILESLDSVSKNPFIGKRTTIINVRAKIVENYMIFYEITELHIVVLSIWDCRQNPNDTKFETI